jgi:S-formylglutathione hydrolase FrmB
MDYILWMASLWIDGVGVGQAPRFLLGFNLPARVDRRLHGRLLDFTKRLGSNRRIYSPALGSRRDLFVYLPPGYDPAKKYPLALFLHGAAQDEQFFLQAIVRPFDRAIAEGRLPPVIIAAPDGSVAGRATLAKPATFWADTRAGAFERYVMEDVWGFMVRNFSVRDDRESHALFGVSMGGSASVALAIKHRDRVGVAVALMPLLNLRHVDCHGRYRAPFDPCCASLREKANLRESLGRRRLFSLRFRNLFGPLYGDGPGAVAGMSSINPLELMERHDSKPGELALYVGYGAKDEFNVAAQVEGFLYFARRRGLDVTVEVDPNGRHDLSTGLRLLPGVVKWAAKHVPAAK